MFVRSCVWITLLLALLSGGSLRADTPENDAFAAAMRSFNDRFYDRADKELADFLSRYATGTHKGEATLIRAQSQFHLKKYDAAFDLINQGLPAAGPLTDEYLFWLGETQLAKGDWDGALASYGRVTKEFPNSSLRLPAWYNQAVAMQRKKDVKGAVALLSDPQGELFKAMSAGGPEPILISSRLLLSRLLTELQKTTEAKAALAPLDGKEIPPALAWERFDLLARLEIMAGTPANALPFLTNALASAQRAGLTEFTTRSLELKAEVHGKSGQGDLALQTYDALAGNTNFPAAARRNAVLQAADWLLNQKASTNAALRLETYLAQNPGDPSADLLHLKAGQLWLEAWRAKTTSADTNSLLKARGHFDVILSVLTNSPLAGQAFLQKGWTLWEDPRLGAAARAVESQPFFQKANDRLPRSPDQAMARFKVADALFAQGQLATAITNYAAVFETYEDVPQVKETLAPQAGHQMVRAWLALKYPGAARQTLLTLQQKYPTSLNTDYARLLFAQFLTESGDWVESRVILDQFLNQRTNSTVLPDAELMGARTLAREGRWSEAAVAFERWGAAHPQHPARAEAEFDHSWAIFQSGNETNAYASFTNYVAQYPANPLAARAQNWVADYFFNQEQWGEAEQSYQKLFASTNSGDLSFQARLMASRTALLRQGYNDARSYLTNLIADTTCPTNLVAEAWYMLGDLLLEQRNTSTNVWDNFIEAQSAFDRITKQFAGHPLEPLAYGKIGHCHFQLASQFPESYEKATNAYLKVIDWAGPNLPDSARHEATASLGLVLEKLADTRVGLERYTLLQAALNRELDVVYRRNTQGPAEGSWLKRAALAAGRISESLGDAEATARLYKRLAVEVPTLRATWQARLSTLEPATEIAPPIKPGTP